MNPYVRLNQQVGKQKRKARRKAAPVRTGQSVFVIQRIQQERAAELKRNRARA